MFENDANREVQLNRLFQAYRDACPEMDASAAFMPGLWSRIEARQSSSNLFGRMARALVTAAVAASIILGVLVSLSGGQGTAWNGTYLEALTADHASSLEQFNLDRVSEMEQQ
jgi:hypothetical protein